MKKKSFLKTALIFATAILIFSLTLSCCIVIGRRHITPYKTQKAVYQNDKSTPTVIIDAGHGGEDGGTVGINGCFEKDINLSIAKKLDEMLRAAGINTVMTRSEDILLYDKNVDFKGRKKVLDLAARLKIANSFEEYKNTIFVSIHMNSYPESKYSGLQVYYSPSSEKAMALAQIIQNTAKLSLNADNERKIKASSGNIYLLDRSTVPSVLIECGFLSNENECTLLCSEDYQKRLSLSIFASICTYFDSDK